jgi:hypothetical protein
VLPNSQVPASTTSCYQALTASVMPPTAILKPATTRWVLRPELLSTLLYIKHTYLFRFSSLRFVHTECLLK